MTCATPAEYSGPFCGLFDSKKLGKNSIINDPGQLNNLQQKAAHTALQDIASFQTPELNSMLISMLCCLLACLQMADAAGLILQ